MKDTVVRNIHQMLNILDDTKREIANGISEDIMNGIFIVSEENQAFLKLIGRISDDLKEALSLNQGIKADITETVKNDTLKQEVPKEEPLKVEEPVIKEQEIPVEKEREPEEEPYEEEADSSISDNDNDISQDWFNDNMINEDDFARDFESSLPDNNDEQEVKEDKTDEEIKEPVEAPFKMQAEVIGEANTEEKVLPFYGVVTNERQKKSGDFIFNKYRISAAKQGFNSASDITLFVAPLQVIPNNPNVPIVVHVYSHGNFKTASSYDTKDSGHNIVTLEIDNFYLLIRGGFDSNGKFMSFVMTTGLSANQGDIINVLSKEEGYTGPILPGSGHIKFEDDGNIYEIFPLNLQENEYLCILISKEFLDYYVVAKNYGSPKIRIFENGTQKEIIAGWSGDVFEADIL